MASKTAASISVNVAFRMRSPPLRQFLRDCVAGHLPARQDLLDLA
jgi:hypothetical protein